MEALYFTKEIRHQIFKSSEEIDEDAIREIAIKQNGMLSLRASGRERIKEGLSTCAEVIAATAES
jgi:type IV pilus assembly protein PilB